MARRDDSALRIRRLNPAELAEIAEFYDGSWASIRHLARLLGVDQTRIRYEVNHQGYRQYTKRKTQEWRARVEAADPRLADRRTARDTAAKVRMYRRRREHDLCIHCGQGQIEYDRSAMLCVPCLEAQLERYRKRRDNPRACSRCGVSKESDGFSNCDRCREYYRNRDR